MNLKPFIDLRSALANFYPDEYSIRRVVHDAGLDQARLLFATTAENSWHSVLIEANKANRSAALLAVVERGYSENPQFRKLCSAYRQTVMSVDSPAIDLPDINVYLRNVITQYQSQLLDEQGEPLGLITAASDTPQTEIGPQLLDTKVTLKGASVNADGSHTPASSRAIIEVLQDYPRFVLVGEPGAGKTTTLKRLAIYIAQQRLAEPTAGFIPVYIPLMQFDTSQTLLTLLQTEVNQLGLAFTQPQLAESLKQEKFLFLLDGLNEVTPEAYVKCGKQINDLFARHRYCRFIVSDRPSYDGLLNGFALFELGKWDNAAIQNYVHQAIKRLGSKRSPDELLTRIEYDSELYSTVNNPLLLGLLTTIYVEKGQIALFRTELLDRFIQLLLERDAHKAPNEPLKGYQLKLLLAELAFAAYQNEKIPLPESFVREQLAKHLQQRHIENQMNLLHADSALQSLLRGHWLRHNNHHYRFNFDALQEMFLAYALEERWQRQGVLDKFICDLRWEEPLIHAIGLLEKGQADLLTNKALELGGLKLAARCAIHLDAQSLVRRKIVTQLRKQLFSPHDIVRVEASRLFIFLQDETLKADLIQAMVQYTGAVRWNAALALQHLLDSKADIAKNMRPSDELFIKILQQHRQDEDLQVAACIALGRSKTKRAITTLIQALDHHSFKVSRHAATNLGRINDATAFDLLEKAAQFTKTPKIQAGALRALQIARPTSALEFANQMRHVTHLLVRQEVELILGKHGDTTAIARYVAFAQSQLAAEQKKALYYFSEVKSPLAIAPLWTMLQQTAWPDWVARVLGSIGGPQVIAYVLTALRTHDEPSRIAAIKVLGYVKNDDHVLEYLVAALRDQSAGVRNIAKDWLQQLGEPATVPLKQAFEEAAQANDMERVRLILTILEEIGTRSAVQILANALDHVNVQVTQSANQSLQRTNLERAILALHEKWRNSAPSAQSGLEPLLYNLETKQHENLLIEYILSAADGPQADLYSLERLYQDEQSNITPTQRSAQNTLKQIEQWRQHGQAATGIVVQFTTLQELYRSADSRKREWVAAYLGNLHTDEAFALLEQATADPHPSVCLMAIHSLGGFPTTRGIALLKKLLVDREEPIQQAALDILSKMENAEAMAALLKVIEHNPALRAQTLHALYQATNPERQAQLFMRMLDWFVGEDQELQALTSQALDAWKPNELPTDYKARLVAKLTQQPAQHEALVRLLVKLVKHELYLSAERRTQVIKQLVRYLGKNKSLNQAIKTLVQGSDLPLVQQALAENLLAEQKETLLVTLQWLGEMRLTRLLPPLEKLLDHPDPEIHTKAATLLCQTESDKTIPLFVKCLQHASEFMQHAGVQGLAKYTLSAPMVTELIRLAKTTPHARVRHAILVQLGGLQRAAAQEALLWALDHSDPDTRSLAVEVLARCKSIELENKLIERLKISDGNAKLSIIRLLGQIEANAAWPALYTLLQAAQGEAIAQVAVLALLQISLHEPAAALHTLAPYLHQHFSALLSALASTQVDARLAALQELQLLQAKPFLPLIAQMLDDPEQAVRLAAIDALCSLGTPEAVQQISRATFDITRQVRQKAFTVLLSFLPQATVAEQAATGIHYLIYDNERALRHDALKALISSETAAATKALQEALNETDEALRWQIVQALANRPWAEAMPSLQKARFDPNAQIRKAAEQAILVMEDKIIQRLRAIAQALPATEDALRFALVPTQEVHQLLRYIDAEAAAKRILEPHGQPISAKLLPDLSVVDITLLGWLGQPLSYEILLATLWVSDKQLRLCGIAAVGNAKIRVALPDLATFIRSADLDEKLAAIYALAQLDDAQALKLLKPLSEHQHPDVRMAANTALQTLQANRPQDRQNVERIYAASKLKTPLGDQQESGVQSGSDNFIARLLAVRASQQRRWEERVGANIAAAPQNYLNSDSIFLQRKAIEQIGQQQLATYARLLIHYLVQKITPLKVAALEALGMLNLQNEAVNQLIQLAESTEGLIQLKAIETLGRWQAKRAIPLLQRLCRHTSTQYAVITALVNIAVPESIEFAQTLFAKAPLKLINHTLQAMARQPQVDWSPALLAGLNHPQEEVRHTIIKHLFYFSAQTVQLVGRQALKNSSQTVVYEVIDRAGLMQATGISAQLGEILQLDQYRESYQIAKAARALGRLQAQDCIAILAKLLQSATWQIAEAAAEALGHLQDEAAVNVLLSTAELDVHNRVELAIVCALAKIGVKGACVGLDNVQHYLSREVRDEAIAVFRFFPPDDAILSLTQTLNDTNAFIRENALKGLILFAEPTLCMTFLRVAAEDRNVYVRLAALQGIQSASCTVDASLLMHLLNDPNHHIRVHTIRLIRQIAPGLYQNELVDLLADENPHVKETILATLSIAPSTLWYPAVANLIREDFHAGVRHRARLALKQAATPEAFQLLQALKDEEEQHRLQLRQPEISALLSRIERYQRTSMPGDDKDEKQSFLADIQCGLQQTIPDLRRQTIMAAIRRVYPELIPLFKSALQDNLPLIRSYAVQGLAKIGSTEALTLAKEHFSKEPVVAVRLQLLEHLPLLPQSQTVIDILEQALADGNPKVAKYAILILTKLADPAVAPLLCKLLTKPHPSDFVREAAVNALAELGAETALPALEKAATDSSWYVRQDAITALAKLNDITNAMKICQKGLADENAYVQRSAIEALLAKNVTQALPLYEHSLNHANALLRVKSVEGIGLIYSQHETPSPQDADRARLATLLAAQFTAEPDLAVKLAIIQTLETLKPVSLPAFFQKHIFEKNNVLRRRLLDLGELIGAQINYTQIEAAYLASEKSLHIATRRDISYFISRHAAAQCADLLTCCCQDSDRYVKANAAYGLRFISNLTSLVEWQMLSSHPDNLIKNVMHQSLKLIAQRKEIFKPTAETKSPPSPDLLLELIDLSKTVAEATSQNAADTLQEILQHTKSKNWLERSYAILRLADYRTEKTVSMLIHLYLDEDNRSVMTEIASVLREMPLALIQSKLAYLDLSDKINKKVAKLKQLHQLFARL